MGPSDNSLLPLRLIIISIMAPSVAEIGNSPQWHLYGLNSSVGRPLAIRLSDSLNDHYYLLRLILASKRRGDLGRGRGGKAKLREYEISWQIISCKAFDQLKKLGKS